MKAMEEVKTLDVQPRRTLRRMGSGMLGQSFAEQGRSHRVAVHRLRQAWYKPVGAKSTLYTASSELPASTSAPMKIIAT